MTTENEIVEIGSPDKIQISETFLNTARKELFVMTQSMIRKILLSPSWDGKDQSWDIKNHEGACDEVFQQIRNWCETSGETVPFRITFYWSLMESTEIRKVWRLVLVHKKS